MRAAQTHARGLQKDLALKYEEQTLAVYPADTMPPPYPVPFPVNREEGIRRYRALLTPAQYRARLAAGDTDGLVPPTRPPQGEPPVFPVLLQRREAMAAGRRALRVRGAADGGALPPFDAGAHIDVVIAPEYLRPYSLAGDPADRSRYVLGVLNERAGPRRLGADAPRLPRGPAGCSSAGRSTTFRWTRTRAYTLLFAGGIGVTPLIAMAHRLHALGRDFRAALQRRQPRHGRLPGRAGARALARPACCCT